MSHNTKTSQHMCTKFSHVHTKNSRDMAQHMFTKFFLTSHDTFFSHCTAHAQKITRHIFFLRHAALFFSRRVAHVHRFFLTSRGTCAQKKSYIMGHVCTIFFLMSHLHKNSHVARMHIFFLTSHNTCAQIFLMSQGNFFSHIT